MSFHKIVDKVSLGLSSKAFKKSKYFRDSIESKSLKENIEAISIQLPSIYGVGLYELKVSTLAGEFDTAFKIAQWKGENYPTIIYHHGAAEIPFDFGFNKIFPIHKENINANLIAIRAPFHRKIKEFLANNDTLSKYVAMISTSVQLMESLVQYARNNTNSLVVLTGVSLGGFSTNLHHTYFNSADMYKPLLSGTKMAQALLESAYSGMISSFAKENSEEVKKVLDFTGDFQKVDNKNVFALLSKHDQVVYFENEYEIYLSDNLTVIDKGHATGSSAFKLLRNHIVEGLEIIKPTL